jgi:hypothetical protein
VLAIGRAAQSLADSGLCKKSFKRSKLFIAEHAEVKVFLLVRPAVR